jgi:hypothetical protein
MKAVAISRQARDTKRETAMFKQTLKHALATTAAAAATLVLFSAVASLADGDKAALVAKRNATTAVAFTANSTTLR